ncbi:hypothetical protein ACJX0J_006978, partial [Zea mays]
WHASFQSSQHIQTHVPCLFTQMIGLVSYGQRAMDLSYVLVWTVETLIQLSTHVVLLILMAILWILMSFTMELLRFKLYIFLLKGNMYEKIHHKNNISCPT